MRMIRPKLDAPQVSIAEDQDEYMTLTGALVRHPKYSARSVEMPGDPPEGGAVPVPACKKYIEVNSLVVAFKPSADERARIANGQPIYVSLLTFMEPMQPILLTIGEDETAAIYGVKVEP